MKSTNGITRTGPAYEFPAISKRLTLAEQAALQVCESRIEDGLKKFDQVWDALLEIREKALYREQHSSFEEYCRQKWNFGARRGRQLSDAAIVMKALKSPESYPDGAPELSLQESDSVAVNGGRTGTVNFPPNGASHRESPSRTGHHEEGNGTQLAGPARTLPTTEKQVRPLTRLKSADEQREAWNEAVAVAGPDKAPSAREVAAVVQKRMGATVAGRMDAQIVGEFQEAGNKHVTRIARQSLTVLGELDELLRASGLPLVIGEKFGQARYFLGCIRTELDRLKVEGGGFGKTETPARTFAKPNSSGVYTTPAKIVFCHRYLSAEIRYVQVENDKWVSSYSFNFRAGVNGHGTANLGMTSLPSIKCKKWASEKLAIADAAENLIKSVLQSGPSCCGKERELCCKWCHDLGASYKAPEKGRKESRNSAPRPQAAKEGKALGFVVCRIPPEGSLRKGPRFGPGRWCADPRKSEVYSTRDEAHSHAQTYDRVMSLKDAVGLYERARK